MTWSTNSEVATVGLTARAETADARDVVGRQELATVVVEVGVELVDVAMLYNFREEKPALLLTDGRGESASVPRLIPISIEESCTGTQYHRACRRSAWD